MARKAFSFKFMLNLVVGASVLPVCGLLLQSGSYEFFIRYIKLCCHFGSRSGIILPIQIASERQDL